MHICRNILILLVLVISILNAEAVTIAKTTANSLNVRAAPGGDVLFTLLKNSIVGILKVQNNWAMVMYLPNNNPQAAKHGWVSVSYLQMVGSKQDRSVTRSVNGDDCEYENDSKSRVCISVTNADLNCREAYDGSYYKSCDVEIDYKVSTDYEGDDYLSVDVECEVEIKYKKREGYSWAYDSDSETENHSLYSYGSESGDMDFDFRFSSYKEVVSVKIDSVECEISSIYKY